MHSLTYIRCCCHCCYCCCHCSSTVAVITAGEDDTAAVTDAAVTVNVATATVCCRTVDSQLLVVAGTFVR